MLGGGGGGGAPLELTTIAQLQWLTGFRRQGLMGLLAFSLHHLVPGPLVLEALTRRPEIRADAIAQLVALPPCIRTALLVLLGRRGHDGVSSHAMWRYMAYAPLASAGPGTAAAFEAGRQQCAAAVIKLLRELPAYGTYAPSFAADGGGDEPAPQARATGGKTALSPLGSSAGASTAASRPSSAAVAGGFGLGGAAEAGGGATPSQPSVAAPSSVLAGAMNHAQLYADNLSWGASFLLASSATAARAAAPRRAGGGAASESVLGWSPLLAPSYLLKQDQAFLHVQFARPPDSPPPSHRRRGRRRQRRHRRPPRRPSPVAPPTTHSRSAGVARARGGLPPSASLPVLPSAAGGLAVHAVADGGAYGGGDSSWSLLRSTPTRRRRRRRRTTRRPT